MTRDRIFIARIKHSFYLLDAACILCVYWVMYDIFHVLKIAFNMTGMRVLKEKRLV